MISPVRIGKRFLCCRYFAISCGTDINNDEMLHITFVQEPDLDLRFYRIYRVGQ